MVDNGREATPDHRWDEQESIRRWAETCAALDELAPRVIARSKEIELPTTRLRGYRWRSAWTFDLMTKGSGPLDALAHMHLGFLPDGTWVLLGYHRGDYRLVVDKCGPLKPGLRQEFIYDRKRREADVIVTLTADQIWELIYGQMSILAALGTKPVGRIRPRSRYG
jgi:hypothetical protein